MRAKLFQQFASDKVSIQEKKIIIPRVKRKANKKSQEKGGGGERSHGRIKGPEGCQTEDREKLCL